MVKRRPEQTENGDQRVDNLRNEIEGKIRWAIGLFLVAAIALCGYFANRIGHIEDKNAELNDRVIRLETKIDTPAKGR